MVEAKEEEKPIVYLSMEAFEKLHKDMREQDNQIFPIQQANIDFMFSRLPTAYENVRPLKERVFHKAAYMLRYFCYEAHAFNNGNKRMSLVYATVFLDFNGYDLKVRIEDNGREFMLGIARGDITSITKISLWLQENSQPVKVKNDP